MMLEVCSVKKYEVVMRTFLQGGVVSRERTVLRTTSLDSAIKLARNPEAANFVARYESVRQIDVLWYEEDVIYGAYVSDESRLILRRSERPADRRQWLVHRSWHEDWRGNVELQNHHSPVYIIEG